MSRGRTTAYAVAAAMLALPAAAAAQSTGGVSPHGSMPAPPSGSQPHGSKPHGSKPAPRLGPVPPGVVRRPAPVVTSWHCLRDCAAGEAARTGSILRVRGRALARAYEVVFRGAEGEADDVSAAPLRRRRNRVDVRVPLGAVAGPVHVADRDGLQSAPTGSLAIAVPAARSEPAVDVQVQARRAFFDAERPAKVSYVVHGDAPAHVLVELVRVRDGAVVEHWDAGAVPPGVPQSLSWDGTAGGVVQSAGRYAFRVAATSAAGVRAVNAQVPQEVDPAEFVFLRHAFPIRGPHGYGEGAARFGGSRGHQGQDVFAACGTPLVAARGGVVKFKQYHARAGHYLVIDGEQTGVDYGYMHLRDAALVDVGDRVRTGQPIGFVGDTGRASACHLHLEMWTPPGWYGGGQPFDPLPSLLDWDALS
jgi:murein DD-endopeptidase MepM/ murein hydrolase activator NlpD